MNDLKAIYHAPDEEQRHARMLEVAHAWEKKYPGSMRRWEHNWDAVSPMFSRRSAPGSRELSGRSSMLPRRAQRSRRGRKAT